MLINIDDYNQKRKRKILIVFDDMNDVYNNIDDYNHKRKRKILIVSDDMIADIMTNKKFQAIIKELFIRLNTTMNLNFLLQLRMMNLIYLIALILFLIYKIILNTSSKNMRL